MLDRGEGVRNAGAQGEFQVLMVLYPFTSIFWYRTGAPVKCFRCTVPLAAPVEFTSCWLRAADVEKYYPWSHGIRVRLVQLPHGAACPEAAVRKKGERGSERIAE
jgi:hypothetical protein